MPIGVYEKSRIEINNTMLILVISGSTINVDSQTAVNFSRNLKKKVEKVIFLHSELH